MKVDLDVENPRDYPYLAYFADPQEWMILVRQPHCWRFLYPLAARLPSRRREEFGEKVLRFIGAGRRTSRSSTPSSIGCTIASPASGGATACS